jgi:NDP-sugar pyrophosphorylase family protein/aminoglycoside/choline kinase family phosphotransferase
VKVPRKAFLLAAGLGTRLRPLSLDVPKPMLPLLGEPLVGRIVDLLKGWGVRDFLVNLHHQPQPLLLYLRDRAMADGLRIHFSYEPDILGTGGALRRAAWFLDAEPFWLVNTDITASVNPAPLLRAFARQGPLAALWVTDKRGPRTVDLRCHRVTSFRSAHPGAPGTFTFCGLHLVSPRVMDYLPEPAFSSVVEAYEAAMVDGLTVLGIDPPGSTWDDIGTPERYLAAHRELHSRVSPPIEQRRAVRALRRGGVHISGGVSIASDVTAGDGAAISNAVLLEGVHLGAGAALQNAILGPGVSVCGPATGLIVRADRAREDAALPSLLDRLGWPLERTAVQVLPTRGSDRRFLRLMRGTHRAMVALHGEQRPENRRYASHARFLRRLGVDVPRPILDAPDLGAQVFEDLGDTTLESCQREMSASRRLLCYRRVLAMALRMHTVSTRAASRLALEPPFTAELYRWEHELFDTHFLSGRPEMTPARRQAILQELAENARRLALPPLGIVHRDLQSSNVMLKGRRCVLIDFQGMRWGPPAYDVASLLCDPYVMLAEDVQNRLLDAYCRQHPQGDAVRSTFWPAAVQRLSQALGAYGRLSAVPGMERFRQYIPGALSMMQRALAHAGGAPQLRTCCSRQ